MDGDEEKVELKTGLQEGISGLYMDISKAPMISISGEIKFRNQSEAEQMFNISMSTDEEARCLHRVVRAMHDGHCPNCGYLAPSEMFYHEAITKERTSLGGSSSVTTPAFHRCPQCSFTVTEEEARAALAQFMSIMRKNCDVFLAWQKRRLEKAKAVKPQVIATEDTCQAARSQAGKPIPRTCEACGLGPCQLKEADASEPTSSE